MIRPTPGFDVINESKTIEGLNKIIELVNHFEIKDCDITSTSSTPFDAQIHVSLPVLVRVFDNSEDVVGLKRIHYGRNIHIRFFANSVEWCAVVHHGESVEHHKAFGIVNWQIEPMEGDA